MATTTIDRTSVAVSRPSRAYRDDLFGRVEEQIGFLKSGRLSEIDALNIADALADLGDEQYDKLESAIRIVALHLLEWDHQPQSRSRSRVLSISEHRRRIARVLKKNPGLKSSIDDAIDEAFEDARGDAIQEINLPNDAFPQLCPYVWDNILNRQVAFDDTQSP